jgi:hypothetical protein
MVSFVGANAPDWKINRLKRTPQSTVFACDFIISSLGLFSCGHNANKGGRCGAHTLMSRMRRGGERRVAAGSSYFFQLFP